MHHTRLVLGFVGTLVAALVRGDAFGSTPTPRPSPANLDHFMAYGVKPSKGTAPFVPLGPVALPRLGGGPYELQKVASLLLPADKNGEGVRHSATHLLEYRLKPSKGTPKLSALANVRVLNQCSDVLVELGKPVALLVPTAKDLANPVGAPQSPPVDHLLCFEANVQKKGPGGAALPKPPKGVQVQVADQFQSRRYDLTNVTRLCVPTDKNGTPVFRKGDDKGKPAGLAPASVQHADEHLLCYKAKPATTEIPQLGCGPATPGVKGTKIPKQPKHASRNVFVANQLGALRLDTTKELELCVPSLAELPSAPSGLRALPGDPQQLVSAATFDLSASPGWTDAEITVEPPRTRFLRTSLGIFFTADATVGAANALLARLRAEIVMMLAGPPYVVVRIPDPGSLDALRALAADVEADPAVASVSLDTIPEPDLLPVDFSPRPQGSLAGQQGLRYIDHLLQARIAAAWNARGAIKEAPALVIVDFFGDGVPGTSISASYPDSLDFEVGSPDEVLHGYQVLGVIAAAPGDKTGPSCFETPLGPDGLACAVGVFPGPLRPRVRAVDVVGMNSSLDLEIALAFAIESFAPARVVVNASIGDANLFGRPNTARQAGQRFIDLVRLRQPESLESKFLLVASAGNVDARHFPNVKDAITNSPFTAAALHPDLAKLTNVIVVDNRFSTDFPFLPGDIDLSSKTGGHLAACGTDVWTGVLPPPNSPNGWTGTSFSSPVVAGVAAYAWAIAPELTVAQVRGLLINNAQPRQGSTPDLDAYATLLDIDSFNAITDFRVRRAVLNNVDRANEGKVDAEDVTDFFLFYHDLLPEERRYGRGDLRAAFAPQTDTVRFDLDANGKFEMVSVQAGTHQIQFNEESVNTDADIMCYTAFAAGPYELSAERVDPGRDRCCKHYKQFGRLPPDAKCHPCPARQRAAQSRAALLDEEPKPLGAWRLSVPSGLLVYDFYFLEDGTVMMPWLSGRWTKNGTWTSTPHEVNGEILYYDVRIDACTDAIQHTRYSFEGTWSPRPETDCFGVVSCPFNADGCPAMQGLLTTSDGITTSPATPVDSKRAEGIDGWAPLAPPELEQCHGGCFEEWWRFGTLACAPLGQHCLEQMAPTCGGFCLPGLTCVPEGGSCTCVTPP